MCTGLEIMAVASVAQGIGGFMQGQQAAGQYEKRAGQILESSKQEMRQTGKAQARRLGSQKTGYAKAGVAMTGSAATFTQEQMKQDELELLTQKYNAQLGIQDEFAKAKESRMQGIKSLIGGGAGATSALMQRPQGFSLGS